MSSRCQITFTLSRDQQEADYELALITKRRDMASALWDIIQYLRGEDKYGDYPEEVASKVSEIREKILGIIYEDHALQGVTE